MTTASFLESARRHGAFVLAALGPLAILLFMAPIGQDPAYHSFADTRAALGMPNFFDVVSNAPFLLAGAVGVWTCLRHRVPGEGPGWATFFIGTALVGIGSAYYHWSPDDDTLAWDRLPLALVSIGFFIGLVNDRISPRLATALFFPAVIAGFGSVIYWHYTNDLRPYIWIQLLPVVTLPVAVFCYRPRHTYQGYLGVVLVLYVLARISEVYDHGIFALTGNVVSGHTLKHVMAALAVCAILAMLLSRTRVADDDHLKLNSRN